MIFDEITSMVQESNWKSSHLSHFVFLAFAIKYENKKLFEFIDTKIQNQKPLSGRIFNAKTIRNYLTVMAYGEYTFSQKSWKLMTEHLIKFL